MASPDIIIVGPKGNTHVAGSLARAGGELGLTIHHIDAAQAYGRSRVIRSLFWRIGKRRAVHMRRFSKDVVAAVAAERQPILFTVGQVPLDLAALSALREEGVRCIHWSTDDPWNPACLAGWHLRTLPKYNVIFTPRRSNIGDFEKLGCRNVVWMPFAFDPGLFAKPIDPPAAPSHDVVFVGGADKDRAHFFSQFVGYGAAPVLVGGYWQRWPEFRQYALGTMMAEELTQITAAAKVNLCLVRRANRDGHVMRSFEIPAVGAFMIAEDTEEHRELFGREGECVLYFANPMEAARKADWALAHPDDRRRMAAAAHRRIRLGNHTYRHRLESMLGMLTP